MDIKPDWTLGTLTLTAGSTAFTTTGSALKAADIQGGDTLMTQSGAVLVIETITGENSGTLYMPCPASAAGYDQSLRVRYQGDASRLPAATRDLINMLSSGNLSDFSQLQGDIDKVPYFLAPGVLGLIDLSSLGGGGTGKGAWNALVGSLAGRAAYNNETEGFRVLVADNGDGQAVIYQKTGASTVDWSMPIPFTGAKGNDGQPNKLMVGSVIEGDETRVTITGTSPNQIVNFVLRRGVKGDTGDVTPAALAAKNAAEAAADAAEQDAARTAVDRTATGQDRTATVANKNATAADRVQTGLDKTAAATSASTASTKAGEAAADRVQTGLDKASTSADRTAVANDKATTTADRVATAADRVATGADKTATAVSAAAALTNKQATDTAKGQAEAASATAVAAAATSTANASATASDKTATAADRVATGSDKTAAAASATTATTQAGIATTKAGEAAGSAASTAADRTAVATDKVTVAADKATTVAARDKAQAWANAPEGQAVEAGQYSAYHWSKVAETAAGGGVQIVNGKTGSSITLTASDVGAATDAQGGKADTALQTLTAGTNITITGTGTGRTINAISTPQVASDWNASSGIAAILNKPTLGTASVQNVGAFATAAQGAKADTAVQPLAIANFATKAELTAGLGAKFDKPTGTAAQYLDGQGAPKAFPAIPEQVQSDWNAASGAAAIKNKPALASVAISGAYGDLSGRPTIPAQQVQSDWNAASGLAAIANKPTLGTASAQNVGAFATAAQGAKADTAVQPVALTTALNDKLDKTGQASDSARLGNETAAQWQAKIDAKAGVYGGSAANEVNFPIGHTVLVWDASVSVNEIVAVRRDGVNSSTYTVLRSDALLTGVWRSRGAYKPGSTNATTLCERVS